MKKGLSTAGKDEKSCIVELARVSNAQDLATSTTLRRSTDRQPIKYRPTAGHSGHPVVIPTTNRAVVPI